MNEVIFDPVLTTEASRILAVSPETVRLWEKAGRLVALKTSRGVRLFDRGECERLANQRQSDAADRKEREKARQSAA